MSILDSPGHTDINDFITTAQKMSSEIGKLGSALETVSQQLHQRYQEIQKLDAITTEINAGLLLEDVMDSIYENFHTIIPYNRIGMSLIEDNGKIVRAIWARSDQPQMLLKNGYASPLATSSLAEILKSGKPRIINDLIRYLEEKPSSKSTQLMVREGFRSSLTCPLIVNGAPVGFVFFSSIEADTYTDVHVDYFVQIAHQVSIVVDKSNMVSEIARQRNEIAEQNRELKRLNELKSVFLGMAAHDLLTPISIIKFGLAVILTRSDQITKERIDHILNDAITQTDNMAEMLSGLLDVTEIEAGTLRLEHQTVEIDHFILNIALHHSQLASAKEISVSLDLAPSLKEKSFYCDPLRIRQVLNNLLSNAIKYSPRGAHITILIALAHNETAIRFAIRDNGPGLSERDKAHIFKLFGKTGTPPTGGERKTGLGLAIAKTIVDAHGGEIGVNSEPGKGSEFWLILPNLI